jgi:serine/threonine-protein kinase
MDSRIGALHTRRMELHSLGGYRLLAPLASLNPACRLYMARPESASADAPATQVVKVLMPGAGEAFAHFEAQFEHEVRLMRHFSHPNIPTVRAAGKQDGVDYFVMDAVEGFDLAHVLGHVRDEPRALGKEVAVYVLGQLADVLRYVHEFEMPSEEVPGASEGDDEDGFIKLDVLHRDICPANVLVSVDGDVLLTDFGSASSRWLSPEHTAAQAGHVAYKAPERVTGSGKASIRSDLFSLAVVLWEMLRGERCFKAGSELETMDAIVRFDISHTRARVSGLSSKLSEVLRRNLDRDPERRYEDAYKVLQRLSQSPEAGAAERARQELAGLVGELV